MSIKYDRPDINNYQSNQYWLQNTENNNKGKNKISIFYLE